MGPTDDEENPNTPKIVRMFVNNEQIQNDPALMMLLEALMGRLFMGNFGDDNGDDLPELSDLPSQAVQKEMMRLEILDEQVEGETFPMALDLIMNAYKNNNDD